MVRDHCIWTHSCCTHNDWRRTVNLAAFSINHFYGYLWRTERPLNSGSPVPVVLDQVPQLITGHIWQWLSDNRTLVISSPVGGRSSTISESVCMFVCLFVCLFAYVKDHMSKYHWIFFYMLRVAMARSFSDDSAIRYVLPVLLKASCFHIMEQWSRTKHDVIFPDGVTAGKVAVYDCRHVVDGRYSLYFSVASRWRCKTDMALGVYTVAGAMRKPTCQCECRLTDAGWEFGLVWL